MKHWLYLLLALAASTWVDAASAKSVSIAAPRVEMQTCPAGIDAKAPQFSWQLSSTARGVLQQAYRIRVATSAEALAAGHADAWDSQWIRSRRCAYIPYRGKALRSGTRYYWQVEVQTNVGRAVSETVHWTTALMEASEWRAQWIGGRFDTDVEKGRTRIRARYLRRDFAIQAPIRRAMLYICGLGLYEAYINGQRIGTQVLSPTPTNYDRSVRYNTFDVTREVRQGANAIGVVLGNGRFMAMRNPGMRGFGLPRLLAQLVITTTDGRQTVIASDKTWQMMADGPIQTNNEFDGEVYNARKAMPGWNEPGYRQAGWQPAEQMAAPAPLIEAQTNPNIQVMDSVQPQSIRPIGHGRYLIDMGQNMVGWLRVRIHGDEGDTLRLRFAERLAPDNPDKLFLANLRTAEVTDTYISDRKPGTWQPAFTYHGFRYVEVSGFHRAPRLSDFQGQVIYDEMATTGTFHTSNSLLNRIYHCAYWGIRGNYRGMPTDCPQRDERLGWLGDRATGALGECYLFDNHLLYAKWIRDITETQRADSVISDVAPRYWSVYNDNVTWPMAWYTVAGMLYDHYGDPRPIQHNYQPMRAFMLHTRDCNLRHGIITRDVYGDWCMPPESPRLIHSKDSTRITDGRLLGTAAYYRLCGLMERFARISGASADTLLWQQLGHEVRQAFNREFYRPDKGYYSNNTVTANLLALRWGLLEPAHRDRVFDNMVQQLSGKFNGHIGTGVLGTQEVMRGLTEGGRGDLAYQLATNTTFPSWGFMVEHGATTIWELWNGDTAEPKMNSGNHVMLLGDLVIWFYQYLAGIGQTADSQGFSHIVLRPHLYEGLDSVSASYHSLYGLIESAWQVHGDQIKWRFTIPANTVADVYVPKRDGSYTLRRYKSGTYHIKSRL